MVQKLAVHSSCLQVVPGRHQDDRPQCSPVHWLSASQLQLMGVRVARAGDPGAVQQEDTHTQDGPRGKEGRGGRAGRARVGGGLG